jgi:hypothetical protein
MAQKYRTSTALAAILLAPETSIPAVGISDFELIDVRSIKLRFLPLCLRKGTSSAPKKLLFSEKLIPGGALLTSSEQGNTLVTGSLLSGSTSNFRFAVGIIGRRRQH